MVAEIVRAAGSATHPLRWVAAIGTGTPLALSGALLLLASDSGSWPVFWTALGAALVTLGLAWRTGRGSRGLAISLLCGNVLLLWPEVILRMFGHGGPDAGVVAFGYPRPTDLVRLQRDPELLWTLRPGAPNTNSAGFLGKEFEIPKPSDVFRALFLGDSCTQQGFPKLVAWELNKDAGFLARLGRARVESVNLGISGYSSYQGRMTAQRWIARLAPDLTVVYFGWNDHWQAYGRTDAERGRSGEESQSSLLRESALLTLLVRTAGRGDVPLAVPRVSLEEYRVNLLAIGEVVERAGGRVALITAPTSYYGLGVPDYLVEQGFAASDEQAIELHRRYCEVVRALAAERGWWLLDLEREAGADPARLAELFLSDGIHFTQDGLRWVADSIAAAMVARLP